MDRSGETSPQDPATCANCGAGIAEAFCGHCGQRRFRPEDRRLAHLLREFAEALTDLDGRFWRSMRALLFRPGLLSRDWNAGRRTRWMSPVALFLLANVLYFFAPALTDFDLPLRDHVSGPVLLEFDSALADATPERRERLQQFRGQLHSRFTEPWVRARLAEAAREAPERNAFETVSHEYALASANISKALIVLHVPFLALLLAVAMAGRGYLFAEHAVVALHYFAFVLFLLELVVLPGAWIAAQLDVERMPDVVMWLLPTLLVLYAVVAIRRAYACRWIRAALAGTALVAVLLEVNLSVYRALQFAIVLALA